VALCKVAFARGPTRTSLSSADDDRADVDA